MKVPEDPGLGLMDVNYPKVKSDQCTTLEPKSNVDEAHGTSTAI